MSPTRSRRKDEGAVLVLTAFLVFTLLVVVAIVVDFSTVRNTRQDGKELADTAVASAGQKLAGTGKIYPWAGACSALDYLRANSPGTTYEIVHYKVTASGARGAAIVGNPCSSSLTQLCTSDRTSWAWIEATTGSRRVTVRAGYLLPDTVMSFAEDGASHVGDVGDPSRAGCDQIAVIVDDTDEPSFGSVAGGSAIDTRVRSVARVRITPESKAPPAFLMLERRRCGVLSQQVGSGEGIAVGTTDVAVPGRIHVDSSGLDSSCNGNSFGGFTVYSEDLGSAPNKFPGIRIFGTSTVPGVMTLRALAPGGNAARAKDTAAGVCTTYEALTSTCLSTTATGQAPVGRIVVDDKYNGTTRALTGPLHEGAAIQANWSTAPDATWATASCTDTTVLPTDPLGIAEKVFVNCGNYAPVSVSFATANEVVFNGSVTLANGSSLAMPQASRVVVGGSLGNGGTGIDAAGGSVLTINTRSSTPPAAIATACADADAVPNSTSQLIVFGGRTNGQTGALKIGGLGAFCNTFVYIGGAKGTAAVPSTYSRLTDSSSTYDASCVAVSCPTDAAQPGAGIRIGGSVRWTAPNRPLGSPPPPALGTDEDLALWTESSDALSVTGVLDGSGVYFLPNSDVSMQSPATFTPRNAQFISRTLKLLQGALFMEPNPNDSITVDTFVGASLVR